jgi:hypothetical protein
MVNLVRVRGGEVRGARSYGIAASAGGAGPMAPGRRSRRRRRTFRGLESLGGVRSHFLEAKRVPVNARYAYRPSRSDKNRRARGLERLA